MKMLSRGWGGTKLISQVTGHLIGPENGLETRLQDAVSRFDVYHTCEMEDEDMFVTQWLKRCSVYYQNDESYHRSPWSNIFRWVYGEPPRDGTNFKI